jgi:hypothetical protein
MFISAFSNPTCFMLLCRWVPYFEGSQRAKATPGWWCVHLICCVIKSIKDDNNAIFSCLICKILWITLVRAPSSVSHSESTCK